MTYLLVVQDFRPSASHVVRLTETDKATAAFDEKETSGRYRSVMLFERVPGGRKWSMIRSTKLPEGKG